MSNYSEQEIRAFKKKDLLNSRMSALKAASIVFEASNMGYKGILAEADKLYEWLQQDQDAVVADMKPSNTKEPDYDVDTKKSEVLPEPTLAQKKVLDAIAQELTGNGDACDMDKLKSKVLGWAEEVHGDRRYPNNASSVEAFLTWVGK